MTGNVCLLLVRTGLDPIDAMLKFQPIREGRNGHVTNSIGWNFSVASIEAEKTYTGLGPGLFFQFVFEVSPRIHFRGVDVHPRWSDGSRSHRSSEGQEVPGPDEVRPATSLHGSVPAGAGRVRPPASTSVVLDGAAADVDDDDAPTLWLRWRRPSAGTRGRDLAPEVDDSAAGRGPTGLDLFEVLACYSSAAPMDFNTV